jgi:hypothetical protein
VSLITVTDPDRLTEDGQEWLLGAFQTQEQAERFLENLTSDEPDLLAACDPFPDSPTAKRGPITLRVPNAAAADRIVAKLGPRRPSGPPTLTSAEEVDRFCRAYLQAAADAAHTEMPDAEWQDARERVRLVAQAWPSSLIKSDATFEVWRARIRESWRAELEGHECTSKTAPNPQAAAPVILVDARSPDIHIHQEAARPTRRVVDRDPETGDIVGTHDEPVD